MKSLLAILMLLLTVSAAAAEELRPLSQEETLVYLEQVAAAQQANLDKLKTWRGSYLTFRRRSLVSEIPPKKGAEAIGEKYHWTENIAGSLQFALDLEHDQLRTEWLVEAPVNQDLDGKLIADPLRRDPTQRWGIGRMLGLHSPEMTLHFEPERITQFGARQTRLPSYFGPTRRVNRQTSRNSYLIPDPRDFGFDVHGSAMAKDAAGIIKSVKEVPAMKGRVSGAIRGEGDGEVFVFTMMLSDGAGGVSPFVQSFSKAQGYQLVEWKLIDSAGKQGAQEPALPIAMHEITIDYQLQDGVWIPANYVEKSYDETGRGMQIEFHLVQAEINPPLADDEFSLKSLGVREGDLYEDPIQKKTFVIDRNLELVEPQDFEPTEETRKRLEAGARRR